MTTRSAKRLRALLLGLVASAVLLLDFETFDARSFVTGPLVAEAEARIGNPLTPGSIAGVARRTTRRVIRRSAIYIAVLPRGCETLIIEGVTLHSCSGTYYQPYQSQFVVVYVD